MRFVNASVAGALFAFALLELLLLANPVAALVFALAAALAALAFKPCLRRRRLRLLALLSTVVMFGFFGRFFSLAPSLEADWYWQSGTLHALGCLIAGFGLIPVVAEYSCRMKAGGCARAKERAAARSALRAALRARLTRLTT